jgi:dipeptidyl-peptidase-4
MKQFQILIIILHSILSSDLRAKELTVESIYLELNFPLKYGETLKWVPNSNQLSYITYDSDSGFQQLIIYDVESETEKIVLSNQNLLNQTEEGISQEISFSDYEWSSDGKGILIKYEGDIFFYNFNMEKLIRQTKTPEIEEVVYLSPDGKKVSFVKDFNLYVKEITSAEEIHLTSDGSKDILNGTLSYVYEEEFGTRGDKTAYWWSPDSRYIAFFQMDQRPVPEFPLINYSLLNPIVENTRYPKAGDPNPIIKIAVIDVLSGELQWIKLTENEDLYYPKFYWMSDSKNLLILKMDRLQESLSILKANVSGGKTKTIYFEEDPNWIELKDIFYSFKKQEKIIWGSEKSGYRHLYLLDNEGKQVKQITSGDWAVTDFVGIDEGRNRIFYIGTEKDLLERHLYCVDLNTLERKQLTEREGIHETTLSPKGDYFIDTYSAPLNPKQVSLHKINGEMIRYLDKNNVGILEEYQLRKPDFFTFKGKQDLEYYAYLIKPKDFDSHKKYPVIIYVYGGPYSQIVLKRYGSLWHHLMVQRGYLVFCMDFRGSDNRGKEWSRVVDKRLGMAELEDLFTGVEYLKSLNYVNPNRIGIWGWSYGGYMVLYALAHTDVFKAGGAIAPVTDWRLYDTIYTERYMELPSSNPEGYYLSSPINFIDNLQGKLFIAHGLVDNNVHFQHTAILIDKLIESGKYYYFELFPSQEHSIKSTQDRIFMFESLTKFFLENL